MYHVRKGNPYRSGSFLSMQYDASGCVQVEAGQERFGKVFGFLVSPNPTNFVLAEEDGDDIPEDTSNRNCLLT